MQAHPRDESLAQPFGPGVVCYSQAIPKTRLRQCRPLCPAQAHVHNRDETKPESVGNDGLRVEPVAGNVLCRGRHARTTRTGEGTDPEINLLVKEGDYENELTATIL